MKVSKKDWKCLEMPEEVETFILKGYFDDEIISKLSKGYFPKQMEDKLFWYEEDSKLYLHRSWTGYCIYIIDLNVGDEHKVIANRNKKQVNKKDIKYDINFLNEFLNFITGGSYKY